MKIVALFGKFLLFLLFLLVFLLSAFDAPLLQVPLIARPPAPPLSPLSSPNLKYSGVRKRHPTPQYQHARKNWRTRWQREANSDELGQEGSQGSRPQPLSEEAGPGKRVGASLYHYQHILGRRHLLLSSAHPSTFSIGWRR